MDEIPKIDLVSCLEYVERENNRRFLKVELLSRGSPKPCICTKKKHVRKSDNHRQKLE